MNELGGRALWRLLRGPEEFLILGVAHAEALDDLLLAFGRPHGIAETAAVLVAIIRRVRLEDRVVVVHLEAAFARALHDI